jgi:ATP-dependent Clp protease protease subunit
MAKKFRLPSKTVILSGEVDDKTITCCMEDILEINEFREFYQDEDQPIKLIINSPGGSVYDGFALIGIMESSILPVHTYAFGQIMSMALPIFVSGAARVTSKYTTFMYHQLAWASPYEKLEWHKQEESEGERLHAMYNDVIFNRTKIPKKILDNVIKTKSEWYFGPEEAKKYKVADLII